MGRAGGREPGTMNAARVPPQPGDHGPSGMRGPAGHARFAPATPSSITNVAFVSSGDPRRSTKGVVRK